MGLIRKLGKETLIYGFGKGVASAIAIFFVPIYTRILGSEGYGFLTTVNVAISLVAILTIAGLDSAVGFYYFDARDDKQKRAALLNGLTFRLVASVGLPILLYPAINMYLSGGGNEAQLALPFVLLGLAKLPFMTLQSFCRDAMRLESKVWTFFWSTLVYSVLSVLFPVLFVIVLGRGVRGVFEAALLSEFISGLLCYGLMYKRFASRIDFGLVKKLLVYGLPILPTSLMFFAMASVDRYFILDRMDICAVGLYAVGEKLAGVIAFLVMSYRLAWGVFGLSIKDRPEARQIYSRVLSLYSLGFGFICIAVTLFGYEGLVILTTPEFYPAVGVVGFLCMVQFINGMFNQVCIGSVITKKTISIPIAGASGLAVNIVGNFVLIDLLGLVGAAIATVTGYAVSVLVMYTLSQKSYRIGYNLIPVLIPVTLCIAAAVAILQVDQTMGAVSIGVKVLILAAVGGVFLILERTSRTPTDRNLGDATAEPKRTGGAR